MLKSFRHAFDGIAIAFRDHPNFRFHAAAALLVIAAGFFFHITRIEFLIIIFTINLVLIVEMVNTSIEEITDLITIKWAQQAKVAKDVAAGMALVTSISAVVVGLVIFMPYVMVLVS